MSGDLRRSGRNLGKRVHKEALGGAAADPGGKKASSEEKQYDEVFNCRITNANGELCKAQDIENGATLFLSGDVKGGKPIGSKQISEWCGLSIGVERCSPSLGVEDTDKKLYMLQSASDDYAALFAESSAPVKFAGLVVEKVKQKKDLPLEAIAEEYFHQQLQNNNINDFLNQNGGFVVNLIQHWLEQYENFLFLRQLRSLEFSNTLAESVYPVYQELIINPQQKEEEKGRFQRMISADIFASFAGESNELVCLPANRSIPNPERYVGKVTLSTEGRKVSLKATSFVEFRCDDQTFIGWVQYVDLSKHTAHIIQCCPAKLSLQGRWGNKFEMFATEFCGEIPLAAVVKDLKVSLHRPKRDGQFFCVWMTSSEKGFFKNQTKETKGECKECIAKNQLRELSQPKRVANTESVTFQGQTYHKGSFVRLSRNIGNFATQYKTSHQKIDRSWEKKDYKTERPELQKFLSCTSKTSTYVTPQCVAQITELSFHGNGAPTAEFNAFGVVQAEAREFHPHLLVPINKVTGYSLRSIAGPAFVVTESQVPDVNKWVNGGPDRFFVQKAMPEMLPRNKRNRQQTLSGDVAPDHLQLPADDKLMLLDVFCGAGAMSLGLQQSGLVKVAFGLDSEQNCTDAFQRNFPEATVLTMTLDDMNVRLKNGGKLDDKGQALPVRGEVEMLCGGTPCQGFSRLNKHLVSCSSQNNRDAVFSFLNTAALLDPKYILFENVIALSTYNEGVYISALLVTLTKLDYQVKINTLQSAAFGTPQSRQRVFVIAAKKGLPIPEFPNATHNTTWSTNWTTLVINGIEVENSAYIEGAPFRELYATEAISDLPKKVDGTCQYEGPPKNPFQAMMRKDSQFASNHVVKLATPLDAKRFSLIPPGGNWMFLPNSKVQLSDGTTTTPLNYKKSKNKKGKLVMCDCHDKKRRCQQSDKHRFRNSLIPYSMAHSAPDNSNWQSCFGRVHSTGPATTVTTTLNPSSRQGRILHPEANRVLTPRELARFQGIPDEFHFSGSDSAILSQIGNGVAPPVAFQVGQMIVQSILKQEN